MWFAFVCIVSGELPLVSSVGGNRRETVEVGPLLNELVVLWTHMPSAHVHLLFSEPMLSAIINASDLQVTTNHNRLGTADKLVCGYSLKTVSFLCPSRDITTCSSLEHL